MLLTLRLISWCIDFYKLKFLYYLQLYLFHYVLTFTLSRFYVTYAYIFLIMYWFLHIDVFIFLSLILVSSSICFYALKFSYYLQLYWFHHVFIFTYCNFYITHTDSSFIMCWFLPIYIFILLIFTLISSCIYFNILTILFYLHLYLFHHVFIFTHWHFYITYTSSYFLRCWFYHVLIFTHRRFYFTYTCTYSDFHTLTIIYYLHLHLFHYVLTFRHWPFYIIYTYPYLIMYWFLHIYMFILLTLILVSECIDFYTLTFLYYLDLYLFHHVILLTRLNSCINYTLCFTQWHFCMSYRYTYISMFWFFTLIFLYF